MLMGASAFCAVSKITAEAGKPSVLWTLLQVRDDVAAIRTVIERPVPPAEMLARLGFTASQEDACRALPAGNLDAVRLMAQAGLQAAPVAIAVGGGQFALCIEAMLLGAAPPERTSELL
jgi:hypothetical protein